MNTPQNPSEVHVPSETIEDTHQLRSIMTGIVGLLHHPHRVDAVVSARGAALEAMAICDRVIMHLDAVAAIQLEKQRAERAQARVTASTVRVAP